MESDTAGRQLHRLSALRAAKGEFQSHPRSHRRSGTQPRLPCCSEGCATSRCTLSPTTFITCSVSSSGGEAHPQRDVEPFGDDVDAAVRNLHVNLHLWIAGYEPAIISPTLSIANEAGQLSARQALRVDAYRTKAQRVVRLPDVHGGVGSIRTAREWRLLPTKTNRDNVAVVAFSGMR
jgi:hypothetical protein